MQVRIKLIEDGKMPVKMHETDAGFDCYARSKKMRGNKQQVEYELGFAIEIPRGYMGLMFPRSSVCNKDLILSNCVGVVDSGYRGEVKAIFNLTVNGLFESYEIGDRVCQMIIVPYPEIELLQADNLDDSDRGTDGFGSTNKQQETIAYKGMEWAGALVQAEIVNASDYETFKNNILDFVKNNKPSEWRTGQAVFNTIAAMYGEIARQVQFVRHIDCYYDDNKIDDFIMAAYEMTINRPYTDCDTKNPLF